MNVKLTCPSKTFFLGEYLALSGAPTLLISSEPRFTLYVIHNTPPYPIICRSISNLSPAGKFTRDNADLTHYYCFEFRDPHVGRGGFGASTAQFLLFYAYKKWLENRFELQKEMIDFNLLLESYIQYAWNGEGLSPSGADLIAQMNGGITLFHKNESLLKTFEWCFHDLDFLIVRTGSKMPTHQHLKNLTTFDTTQLTKATENAILAFENYNSELLIKSVIDFGDGLSKLQLVSQHTIELLEKINQACPILASKGCGAMGADVLFLLVEKSNLNTVSQWCHENNLSVVGTSQSISAGVTVDDSK